MPLLTSAVLVRSLRSCTKLFAVAMPPRYAMQIDRLQANYSTAPSHVYEIRIYRANPGDFKKLVDLFNEKVGLRMAHSKLLGFWTSEIGDSISQVVHIWEYDSLEHRLKVRKGLVQDQVWMTEFMPHLLSKVQIMTNVLTAPVPGSSLNVDFPKDPAAVYELQTVERCDKNSPPVSSGSNDETLVGRFLGVYGPTKTEYRLWRYPSIDAAFNGSWKRTVECPEKGTSLLLYPTSFSPIQ